MPIRTRRYRFILEGDGCKKKISQEYLRAFIRELTEKIGMTLMVLKNETSGAVIPNPGSLYENGKTGKAKGYSAWAIWQESGIQLHHFEEDDNLLCLDLFSCKQFRVTDVDLLFRWYFRPEVIRNCVPILSQRTQ